MNDTFSSPDAKLLTSVRSAAAFGIWNSNGRGELIGVDDFSMTLLGSINATERIKLTRDILTAANCGGSIEGFYRTTTGSQSMILIRGRWVESSLCGIVLEVPMSHRSLETEEDLRLTLDAGGLGTFDYDNSSQRLLWSDRTKALYGLPADAEIGLDTQWKALPPEDAAKLRTAMRGAVERMDGQYAVEHRAIGIADGVERWIASWGRVVRDSEGCVTGFRGLSRDIIARKVVERELQRARARQEILTDVVSRLLTAEHPQTIIEELAKKVMGITGADVFFNYLVDQGTGTLHLNASAGVLGSLQTFRQLKLGEAVCGRVAAEGKSKFLENICDSSRPETALLRGQGVQTYTCYPLCDQDGILGTLSFGTRSSAPFSPEDLELMQSVANHFAVALKRLRDQTALKISEERYRIIARNIPAGGVWVVDQNLRFVAVEGPLASRFQLVGGFKEGDVIDNNAADGQAAGVAERFKRALAGEEISLESEYRGASLWTHYVPIRDDRGQIVAALALSLDIAERKQAESALRESEKRERSRAAELQAIMDAVPAATWVARDTDCSSITGNRFGYEILRQLPGSNISLAARDEHAPNNFDAFINGRKALVHELPLQHAARTGTEVRNCELELRFHDGHSRYIYGNAMPLLDTSGKPHGAVGAFLDITDQKRFDEQLRQTQKLESIGTLAGGIAHDFNNLLTGILGYASLAQMEATPGIAEKLGKIVEASEKASVLTRQMLAYAGKGQFLISDVDLAKVIHSASNLIHGSVTKNIEVDFKLVPASLHAIRADAAQIKQVVMNLVLNAAEAIGVASPGTITLSAGYFQNAQFAPNNGAKAVGLPTSAQPLFQNDTFVYFRIADDGCGMADDERSKIFDPFFTTKFTGRGLGLAAVQGIVRSLGGEIQVNSTPGKGSTFTVLFPSSKKSEQSQASAGLTETRSLTASILVVDDESMLCEMAQAALEKYGHSVSIAGSGREALDLLQTKSFDLIVLDLIMPGMGGLDVLAEIRKMSPEARVLLTSGFDRSEAETLGDLRSEVPFIQKPYTIHQLAKAVAKSLAPVQCVETVSYGA